MSIQSFHVFIENKGFSFIEINWNLNNWKVDNCQKAIFWQYIEYLYNLRGAKCTLPTIQKNISQQIMKASRVRANKHCVKWPWYAFISVLTINHNLAMIKVCSTILVKIINSWHRYTCDILKFLFTWELCFATVSEWKNNFVYYPSP